MGDGGEYLPKRSRVNRFDIYIDTPDHPPAPGVIRQRRLLDCGLESVIVLNHIPLVSHSYILFLNPQLKSHSA